VFHFPAQVRTPLKICVLALLCHWMLAGVRGESNRPVTPAPARKVAGKKESAPEERRAVALRALDLRDCIQVALSNNLGLSIRRYQTSEALDDVQIARAQFDPVFLASAGRTEAAIVDGVPTATAFDGLVTFVNPAAASNKVYLRTYSSSLSMQLMTGATLTLSGNSLESFDTVQVLPATSQTSTTSSTSTAGQASTSTQTTTSSQAAASPSSTASTGSPTATPAPTPRPVFRTVSVFDSEVALTLRQPLLKGAGIHVNRIPIEIGLIGVDQSNLDMRKAVLDLLESLESSYWELLYATREREIDETNLRHAQQLVAETEARVKVGLATALDTLQAEAALASRRESLILSTQAIADRNDGVLLLLSKLGQERYKIEVPSRFPPLPPAPNLDDQKELDLVRQLPEYAQQVLAIKQGRLLVDKAKNDLLPSVDLTAGGGYVGRSNRFGNSFEDAVRDSHQNWQLLLEVRVPLGFREERANLAKSRKGLEIQQMQLRDVEQHLLAQIRTAARSLTSGRERVKTTELAMTLNEQQYEQVFAKYKQGLVAFRETLLSLDDLEMARLAFLQAQRDAVQAAIRMARLDGTLLLRNQLEWPK